MKTSLRRAVAPLACIGLLLPVTAGAVEYAAVLPAKSSLSFVSKQMGVPINGSFARFDARLVFDPAKPEKGTATLDIHLASIDAGSPDATDEVGKRTWFDIATFPTARFVSTSVKPLGGNRYEVAGKMTIKGRTRDLSAPFTFRQERNLGVFEGAFTLKRTHFGLGEGPWADIDTVADEVQVRFRVTAAPKK